MTGSLFSLEVAPPLAGMCALAAFASLLMNQLALPMIGATASRTFVFGLQRGGAFAENLAVISGTIALVASAFSVMRGAGGLSLFRRVFGAVLLAILLRAVLIATLLERENTTSENVYLAAGAAQALCVLCGMAAIDAARTRLARMLAGLATSVPLLSLLAATLSLTDVHFDPWKRHSYEVLHGLGEVAYLALMLIAVPAFLPPRNTQRAAFARALAFAVFGSVVTLLYVARGSLRADFTMLIYQAARVGLLLDRWPFGYALPFAAALGTAASALVAGGRRFQAGAALLLVFVSGYGPQAPGRLLTMTLGFVLLARAQTVFEESA